jgi:uncharacterized RDD family membrane protein YckC
MMQNVGIGTRVINFLIDTAIIFLLSYLAAQTWKFYVFYYHIIYFPFYYFFFAITVIYYVFFEFLFARTPGKWLSFSKVVNANGAKPSFIQILIRSVVRLTIIDCFFIPFLDKSLHDYVSKTNVVEI